MRSPRARTCALVLVSALLVALLPVSGAAAAPPKPPTPMPPELDLIDVYQGQQLCDPTPKTGALKLRDTLWATYGRDIWAGISRDCNASWDPGISEHKDGRAIDWGVSVRNSTRSLGDEFVAWATANDGENARRLGIMYIIWDSRMWRTYDMDRGWTEFSACLTRYTASSYDTTCHRDHVHISMTWHGAGAWTSWYDGTPVQQQGCKAGKPIQTPVGSPGQPAVMLDPLAGIGVPGGRSCYLDDSIQTLQVPVHDGTRQTLQRLRVEHVHTNAPSPVKIWSNAGGPVLLQSTDTFPREFNLPVASDGRIYVQAPVGQASVRVLGAGQMLPLVSGQVLEVPVAGGSTGVPQDAAAVALNVTVHQPQGAGYLTVFPCGQEMPLASVLNFAPEQTIANAVVVKPGSGGRACVYTSATTHVIVDATGFHPQGSSFAATPPTRLADTRQGARPAAGQDVSVTIPGPAAAAALSIAVTDPSADGWVTVYPCGSPLPRTSSVNFKAGQTIAGNVMAKVGAAGRICLRAPVPTHLIVDLMGTMASTPGYADMTPQRLQDTRLAPGVALAPDTELAVTVPLAAKAVNVTLTATQPQAWGWITAYACGTDAPGTSTLNFSRWQTIANQATIAVGGNGKICLRSSAPTHVIADVTGAYLPGGEFETIVPRRLADTRYG